MVSISIVKGKFYLTDGDKTQEIVERDPANDQVLKLPVNSSNRKWFSIKKVMENGGKIDLTYKETKTFGPRAAGTRTPKKSWTEYLTDAEKVTYDGLKTACEKRKAEDIAKPKTELEKALEKVQKYQALIAKLQAEQTGE